MTRSFPAASAAYTVWVDVDDLFHYAIANPRPSGIQRLVYEILRVLETRAATRANPPRIRFVRRGRGAAPLAEVRFEEIAALFDRLSGDVDAPAAGPALRGTATAAPQDARGSLFRRVLGAVAGRLRYQRTPGATVAQQMRHDLIVRCESLPPDISEPLLKAGVFQIRVVRLLARLARSWRRGRQGGVVRTGAPACSSAPVRPSKDDPTANVAKNMEDDVRLETGERDVFLIPGAAWSDPRYGERLRDVRERYGLQPVLLLYDLIPARRPEWCAHALVRDFRHWLDTTLPQCRHLLAISNATAQDVTRYAEEERLTLAAPVRTIPLGTGFGLAVATDCPPQHLPGLPAPGSYVLFVSTLEARKNHALLFRVWQRLIAELGRDRVPTLVFAGRVGWLVADLMQQLENSNWLNGKIRLVRDPTDTELRELYRGCQFTLFPSLFEGWGLPVTESLMLGAPCVASNATSVPEAGGVFARYFDPESVSDATAVIRDVLMAPDRLVAWREEVETRFPRVPWEATADAILEACAAAHAGAMVDASREVAE